MVGRAVIGKLGDDELLAGGAQVLCDAPHVPTVLTSAVQIWKYHFESD